MSKKIKDFKPENRCLVYFAVTFLVVFLILLPFSICFNLYGLIIGWSIGCAIAIPCLKLIFKSAEMITAQTVKSGFAFVFYLLRMILYVGALVLCACMQWICKLEPFYWSVFTCAAAYLPMLAMLPFAIKERK